MEVRRLALISEELPGFPVNVVAVKDALSSACGFNRIFDLKKSNPRTCPAVPIRFAVHPVAFSKADNSGFPLGAEIPESGRLRAVLFVFHISLRIFC
jgi:hypothetical protein